jgi:hypothetical protein
MVETVHPPITNPNTGRTVAVERGTYHVLVGDPMYNDVRLDEAWNVVPGRWTFIVLYESRVLLQKSFDVHVDTLRPNQSLEPTTGRCTERLKDEL